jgi:hypothetical protein
MRPAIIFLLFLTASCGVETAGTAASSATIKKQELDAGKQAMERAEQKIGQSLELQQQRARSDADK